MKSSLRSSTWRPTIRLTSAAPSSSSTAARWRNSTPARRARGRREETTMAIGVNHVHVKTRDPKSTMQFYVESLGATLIADLGTRGYRVDLHGLALNITTIIDTQHREQRHGIEHLAIDTDDYTATLARLRSGRLRALAVLLPPN